MGPFGRLDRDLSRHLQAVENGGEGAGEEVIGADVTPSAEQAVEEAERKPKEEPKPGARKTRVNYIEQDNEAIGRPNDAEAAVGRSGEEGLIMRLGGSSFGIRVSPPRRSTQRLRNNMSAADCSVSC